MNKDSHLIISIHDVAPIFSAEINSIVDVLRRHKVKKISLLVVPFYHGQQKLSDFPEFVRQLREWQNQGCEIVLHGWTHLEAKPNRRWFHRVATAGEGEFAELSFQEAHEKLQAGLELFQQLGLKASSFVPPAWLLSREAFEALRSFPFEYTENHCFIRRLSSGLRIWSPVITYIHRSRWRRTLALLWNPLVAKGLLGGKNLRLAIHPPDVRDKIIFRQIEWILKGAHG